MDHQRILIKPGRNFGTERGQTPTWSGISKTDEEEDRALKKRKEKKISDERFWTPIYRIGLKDAHTHARVVGTRVTVTDGQYHTSLAHTFTSPVLQLDTAQ